MVVGRLGRAVVVAGVGCVLGLTSGWWTAHGGRPAVSKVPRFGVFQQTIAFPTRAANPWERVSLRVRLTAPSGRSVGIGGFYTGSDRWQFRFSPDRLGRWRWRAEIRDTTHSAVTSGAFTVVPSSLPGFVRVSPYDRFRWISADGRAFNPIGIQSCTVTRLSPNPLRYWGLDGGFAHDEASLERWVDMDRYMRVYRTAGFNLFRWGPDNCSFSLADRIDPRGNVYSLRFAHYADLLFATLRRYGYRIEMVLFGSHPPFPQGDGDPAEMAAVERYVRYIVDRFGAEVDYWELMNEATVSDGWYRTIATYLRRVDPYRHPIGTSVGKPGLPVIDFGSDHWYQTENELESDLVAWQRLRSEPARAFGKPTLVDEQGNVGQNWDPGSATRMRLRSWTAFFAEATLVFWNSSDEKDYRSPVAANIYLGPQERRYIRILQDYTSGFDPRAHVTGATAAGGPGLRAYALRGPRDYGLYLVDGDSHSLSHTGVAVAVDPARSGVARWIEPATGRGLATIAVRAGKQTLPVPAFSTDIALEIAPGR